MLEVRRHRERMRKRKRKQQRNYPQLPSLQKMFTSVLAVLEHLWLLWSMHYKKKFKKRHLVSFIFLNTHNVLDEKEHFGWKGPPEVMSQTSKNLPTGEGEMSWMKHGTWQIGNQPDTVGGMEMIQTDIKGEIIIYQQGRDINMG